MKTDWKNYRRLEQGEIVQKGDHFLTSDSSEWKEVVNGIGRSAPDPKQYAHTWYRRRI